MMTMERDKRSLGFSLGDALRQARTKEGRELVGAVREQAKALPSRPLAARELEEHERTALDWAVTFLGFDREWATRTYQSFRRPAQPIKMIVLHSSPDPEAFFIAWLLRHDSAVRERFNIAPEARVTFVTAGPLRPSDPLWAAAVASGVVKAEQLKAEALEERGYLFVDCGGGGARLDSHGAEENAEMSRISSLDRLAAMCLGILYQRAYLLPAIEVLSRNDKFGEWLARGKRGEITPHVDRQARNLILGWLKLAGDQRTISLERVTSYADFTFDAAERYLLEVNDRIIVEASAEIQERGEAVIWEKLREFRYRIFLWQTIRENLPDPPSQEEADQRAKLRAQQWSVAAAESGETPSVDELTRLAARLIAEERQKVSAFSAFRKEYIQRSVEALERLERCWLAAERDWRRWHDLHTLEGVCFYSRDDSGQTPTLVPTRGRVYLVIAESEEDVFGSVTRKKVNSFERAKLREQLTAAWRQYLAENPLPPEFQSAADGEPDSPEAVSGRTARQQGVYQGLPAALRVWIEERVSRCKANLITVQLKSTVVRDGEIADCKFTISTSQIMLNEVAASIRRAMLAAWRAEAVNPDLRQSGPLQVRDGGRLVQLDHFPDFRTVYADELKTNRSLPRSRLSASELLHAVRRGFMEASAALQGRIERGEAALSLESWQLALPPQVKQ